MSSFYPVYSVPIDKIKPYLNNAKLHPDSQINLLVKQIAEGWDQPIVVDKDYVIIKGHGRRLAALKMGLKTVPVVVRDDLTPQQVKAARIADNKLAETDWDMEALKEDLEALSQFDFDLEDLGFDESELSELLGRLVEDNFDDETEYQEPEIEKEQAIETCPNCGKILDK